MNKKIKIEKQVNKFYIDDKLTIWYDKIIKIDSQVIYNGNIVNINRTNNTILIQIDYEGNKAIYDLKECKKINSGEDGVQLLLNNHSFIRTKYNKDYTRTYLSKYNIISKKDEWELSIGMLKQVDLIKKNLYIIFDEFLVKVQMKNGEQLLQYPLSQLSNYITDEGEEKPAELISIIGIHNTILWLLVTDRRLIGLDTETGTLLHEINICEALNLKPNTVELYSFSLGDTHLDEEKGIIKGFAHRYYWELNLNSLLVEIKVDFGEGNTWRIKKSKYYQGDKNLYFTGARSGETFDRAIGIFDTEKLEIIWYDEPLGDGRYLFFTDIQANDKLIGALDSEQNLRIYERD